MQRVKLTACDLDPHENLGAELSARAEQTRNCVSISAREISLTAPRSCSHRLLPKGPYDPGVVCGTFCWLPKLNTVTHLHHGCADICEDDATLVTDCSSRRKHNALSGRCCRYKAHYYTPGNLPGCCWIIAATTVCMPQSNRGADRTSSNHVVVANA